MGVGDPNVLKWKWDTLEFVENTILFSISVTGGLSEVILLFVTT